MGNLLRSRDDMINLANTHGSWRRTFSATIAATTAATTNCGKISVKRAPIGLTIPTLGAGISAAYFTEITLAHPIAGAIAIAGHETLLGTLTVSGNSFSAGTAMPTKTVEGSSVTTATIVPVAVATTAYTATTPVLTITYTNQDGTTGQTCSMTLPTNATVNTGFFMIPHLATGDTGVREVTNMSISTGSAGVIRVYGILPQCVALNASAGSGYSFATLTTALPMIPFTAGETLGFYTFGATGGTDIHATVCAIGDD